MNKFNESSKNLGRLKCNGSKKHTKILSIFFEYWVAEHLVNLRNFVFNEMEITKEIMLT